VESSHEVLAGLVERVTFRNPENGFCVLRIKARGHRDLVTIVGHAAMISAGEWLTASGESVIIIREGHALSPLARPGSKLRLDRLFSAQRTSRTSFHNVGPGWLDTTDIHASDRWIQTDALWRRVYRIRHGDKRPVAFCARAANLKNRDRVLPERADAP
jgi:hypothetical protein